MHSVSRRLMVFGTFALTGMMVVSGCATKKWVKAEIAPLDKKITDVSAATKENAERIDAVDRRAQQGITAAATADTKATAAGTAAQQGITAAAAADRKADTANQGVTTVNTRVTAIDAKINALDTYTAGPAQSVTFKNNSAALSDDAKKTLDGFAGQVSGMNKGYLVEVQGYTDSRGTESSNVTLSQKRADSVLRYLVSKGVQLHRISIIGQGEENPVGDNKTKAGRDQNRRVEVRLLRAS